MTKAMVLRSISLREDLAVPGRLSHYRPTSKSLAVVRAIMGRDATMAVAPYGSGKSIAAGVGALIVQNEPSAREALLPVLDRLRSVDKELHERVMERHQSDVHGRTVILTGYERELAPALLAGTQITTGHQLADDPSSELAVALQQLSASKDDHIAVVWDEFGRHIEGLIADGRQDALQAVQHLAEWASRATYPSASLVLLMHQGLLAYAGGLNQTSRNEWRKVEGRFQHLRFIDDSRELYELIVELVSANRPKRSPRTREHKLRQIAQGAASARWFDGEQDVDRVSRILRDAEPLTAGGLQILPTVVARVGQNQRSLFSFIGDNRLDATIGTTEVYQAFSDAMRTDVGIGGTHRRWVETENALSRADGPLSREALTTACLFQLGTDGERRRLSRAALELSLASRFGCGFKKASNTVQSLIKRKLIIHRRSHDDITIWCGADVDLATKIRDFRSRRIHSFDLIPFLNEHHPPPFIRPARHNSELGVTRYLTGSYFQASTVLEAVSPEELLCHLDAPWGRVLYLVSDDQQTLEHVRGRILNHWAHLNAQAVFVLPNEPLPLLDAALEVAALVSLREDDAILGEDPLVSQEIDELLSIARTHLDRVLHRLVSDRSADSMWICRGQRIPVSSDSPAGIAVSRLMDEWYHQTPPISNDQLMRNQLTRQMRTATVRVILRIMERSHRHHLDYAPDDTSAEASVYRTVLEHTGLHISEGAVGRFATPEEISDSALRHSWSLVRRFFHEPAETPKPLSEIVAALRSMPIGMPLGVIPIFVMAGYRAFARVVTVCTDGKFVSDLLGFNASNMFVEPDRHSVMIYSVADETATYLKDLAYVFNPIQPRDRGDLELIRFASDALDSWKQTVPRGAWRSNTLPDNARTLLRLLWRAEDPAVLLLQELPTTFGGNNNGSRYRSTLDVITRARNDVDQLITGYVQLAVQTIEETLAIVGASSPRGYHVEALRPVRDDYLAIDKVDRQLEEVGNWISCLDVPALLARKDLAKTDRAVLGITQDTIRGHYTPQDLARKLSSILLQQGCDQWQDSTIERFRMLLRECKRRIEDAALSTAVPGKSIAPLIRAKIRELEAILHRA